MLPIFLHKTIWNGVNNMIIKRCKKFELLVFYLDSSTYFIEHSINKLNRNSWCDKWYVEKFANNYKNFKMVKKLHHTILKQIQTFKGDLFSDIYF